MKKGVFFILFILLLIGCDQWSKHWVEANFVAHQSFSVMPFWAIYPTRNFGISFSMFAELGPWALVGISVLVSLFVVYLWWQSDADRKLLHLGFALILAGAIGNLIDRAMLGYVIDFIQFHTDSWSFAIFNLADSYITCGAGAIILSEIINYKKS